MSAISGAGQGLYQFLQNISANTPTTASTGAAATTSTDSQAIQGGGHHHHHHGGGAGGAGGAGFQKLAQAVTTALQTASANGSTADPNTTIEDAIEQIFGNSNAAAATGTATPQAATTGTPATTTGTPQAASAGATDATEQTDQPSSAQQAFLQTLQSFGVTPEQFHQDLMAAFQKAQGGQFDPSTAFQSFPPGTTIDTTA